MKKQLLALAATSTTVLGLVAGGAMGATTAFASGGGTTCQNDQSISGVQCLGQINGNSIEIDISNVGNGNNLQLVNLQNDLNNILNESNIDILGIQAQVNAVAVAVVPVVIKDLDVVVCQVKVAELGYVNTNLANCN